MIADLSIPLYYLTTDLLVQLIFAIAFPALAIGLAVKTLRNFDQNY